MRRLKIIKIMAVLSTTLIVSLGTYWQYRLSPLRKAQVNQQRSQQFLLVVIMRAPFPRTVLYTD
ncbi:hypothetical protein N7X57_10925 [Lactiplantibacillus paraplantarum]|uniref:hypothetical protein n=1 Tax=Lactiplantibacillus paraplantarum TaxID=60520 RepID=UPI000A682925|nr:hypothetical protein [Lactiplantibacillus paraplantarum]MCW1910936.1 hypothetical protein [Lactiplantibacillus paraplantarum]